MQVRILPSRQREVAEWQTQWIVKTAHVTRTPQTSEMVRAYSNPESLHDC
jgi:hypothetical protein